MCLHLCDKILPDWETVTYTGYPWSMCNTTPLTNNYITTVEMSPNKIL